MLPGPNRRAAGTPAPPGVDWRTIAALNAASTLAQIGQYGIAFVVLPVWLAAQGLDASQLGLFAASLWFGQLPGLAVAPWLCQRFGARRVIAAGLVCTLAALALMAFARWPLWLAGGVLAGIGLGLRWIGLEPWLYRIAPAGARGRLVGFHETLIALAPIVAPLLAGAFGVRAPAVFWLGAAFTLLALVPLAWTRDAGVAVAAPAPSAAGWRAAWHEPVFRLGLTIALIGGMVDAAVAGLFAPFAQGRGYAVDQAAEWLAVFGVGGLAMQYAAGWFADRHGLRAAAGVCAVGTALAAAALVQPLGHAGVAAAVFLLGGFVTAFLTLALVAGTSTAAGGTARNVSTLTMLYTGGGVIGPLGAGATMAATHADALMWLTAAAAVVLALAVGIGGRLASGRVGPGHRRGGGFG